MNLSDREKIVVTLLPLGLILGGYAWWFNLFERHKLTQVQTQYEQALEGAVRPVELMSRKADVARLRRDVESLTAENRELQQRTEQVRGAFAGRRRIAAVDELTALFARHSLAIVEECPADQGKREVLPASLAAASSRLMEPGDGRVARVRCIEFVGRYADVLAALEEIAADETPPAIPVGLTMSAADVAVELRQWTLLVWM